MSIILLRKKAAQQKKMAVESDDWVSENNLTSKIVECIQKLKVEKLQYIASHNMTSHYKIQKHYRVIPAEVARRVGCAVTTLTHSSAYSDNVKEYIQKINEELELEKRKKIKTHKSTLSAGMKQRKKDEISRELQMVRKDLEELKKKNAEEQVLLVLKSLSLPVRNKLGID